jgi:tetratricopeptide (TPR) repeat protein
MKRLLSAIILSVSALTFSATADTLLDVQRDWAHVNYDLTGDEQEKAFNVLLHKAEEWVKKQPDSAEAHIWLGITQSSFAGVKGGLGALSLAKKAKKNFEQALRLDENALSGSAMVSLGVLYHKVPGWPLGFGDDDKAKDLILAGLKQSPDGIDSNYFAAEFFYDNKQYDKALSHLQIAQTATPRADRPLADKGRQLEIATLKQRVEAKLN